MSNSNSNNARSLRSLVIEPFKQMRFGLYILLVTTVFLILSLLLVLYSFVEQYQQLMDLFHVVDKSSKWELVLNDVFISNISWIGLLYCSFTMVLFTLVFKLTHRYYGPLVAITRFIKQMRSGDYSQRITLRKNDELQELARDLNLLAEDLQKKEK
jgi:nitrate/nitrite-specific signal transduction histidine kinase